MFNRPLRRRKGSDGPNDDWLTTFSDCMTLLLTFFVMLLSFSSFNPQALTRVHDAFQSMSKPSISSSARLAKDSAVSDEHVEFDRTEEGSETPTDDLGPTDRPREPLDPLSGDAYRDRRVLVVPSSVLFWARGDRLRPEAREVLGHVANFLRAMPCHVVVSETSSPVSARPMGLARSWAVLRHFTDVENLAPERFRVANVAPGPPDAEPVLRIAMLNPKVYP